MAARIRAPVMLALCLAACVQDEQSRLDGVSVYDSAGIRIVEHAGSAPANTPRWTLGEDPVLTLGGDSSDQPYDLHRVASVARTGSGDFVVANLGTSEILVVDTHGRHLRTMGGRGSGPGEFRALGWTALLAGDSILAYDMNLRRLSIFEHGGSLVRTVEVREIDLRGRALGILANHAIVVPVSDVIWQTKGRTGAYVDSVVLRLVRPGGDLLKSLGPFPGGDYYYLSEGGGFGVGAPIGLGPALEIAVGDSLIYLARTDRYEIKAMTADGRVHQITRMGVESLPVTPEMIRSYMEWHLTLYPEGRDRERFRRLEEAMPFPTELPKLGSLRAGPAGSLWARDYSLHPDSSGDWSVFGSDGQLLARVRTPGRFDIKVIRENDVTGVWKDENDVEHILVLALDRER